MRSSQTFGIPRAPALHDLQHRSPFPSSKFSRPVDRDCDHDHQRSNTSTFSRVPKDATMIRSLRRESKRDLHWPACLYQRSRREAEPGRWARESHRMLVKFSITFSKAMSWNARVCRMVESAGSRCTVYGCHVSRGAEGVDSLECRCGVCVALHDIVCDLIPSFWCFALRDSSHEFYLWRWWWKVTCMFCSFSRVGGR